MSSEPFDRTLSPTTPPITDDSPPPAPVSLSASPARAAAILPHLSLRRIMRWALVGLAIYVIGWLLWNARSALQPFIIGIVLAYLLLPLVNRLDQRIPRWAAILIVYVGGLLVLIGFFSYVVPPLVDQIGELLSRIPNINQLETQANVLMEQYERLLGTLPPNIAVPIREGVNQGIDQGTTTIQSNLTNYVQDVGSFLLSSVLRVINTVTFLLGFFLVPFWLFYVLLDQRAGKHALNRLLPTRIRSDFWAIVTITDRVLLSYIRGQIILGFAVGTAAGLGLLVLNLFGLNVNYVLLLAVFAGITELIPVIGPIIGAIPAIILGLIDSPTTALAVTILYIAIQQLENQILVPRIIGESVDIHPAVLMVLLVVFSQVFGLIGAILCAPTAAVARDVFIYLYGRLSEPPAPPGVLPSKTAAARSGALVVVPPPAANQPASNPTPDALPHAELPPSEVER